jgi:hypothetical protein
LAASASGSLLGFPSKIQIQTVDRCNYLCPMCPYPETAAGGRPTQLPVELFHRLIEEVRAAGRKVKLCLMLQNEPFLDPRFMELLAYAHAAEDAVGTISTVTNGSVLGEAQLDALMAYERLLLTISVNATDRARYLQIHGRDFWDRVHGRLAAWGGPRARVRLSFVLDATSVAQAKAFREYWQGLGYATRLTPINSRAGSLDVARVHVVEEEFRHCHYPVDTLNVLADGSVILCCNDWRHQQRFGDLRRQTIAEVWNAPALTSLRAAAIEGRLGDSAPCRGCDYPVRSSQRLHLEALVGGESVPAPVPGIPFATHRTTVRLGARRTTALVWNLDPERGAASLLLAAAPDRTPCDAGLELRIGHSGAFDFGSLATVCCPGTLRTSGTLAGSTAAEIELDRSAEEFRFFRWYCADWAVPSRVHRSASPATRRTRPGDHGPVEP